MQAATNLQHRTFFWGRNAPNCKLQQVASWYNPLGLYLVKQHFVLNLSLISVRFLDLHINGPFPFSQEVESSNYWSTSFLKKNIFNLCDPESELWYLGLWTALGDFKYICNFILLFLSFFSDDWLIGLNSLSSLILHLFKSQTFILINWGQTQGPRSHFTPAIPL